MTTNNFPVEPTIECHRRMVGQLLSDKFAIDRVSDNQLHAILGVSSEAGELVDALKKAIFFDFPLDVTNCDEEFGDILFYIQLWCVVRGIDIRDLLTQNDRKLRTRYPDGWSQDKAVNRDIEAERQVLEGGAQ